jgi:hypothetical protein
MSPGLVALCGSSSWGTFDRKSFTVRPESQVRRGAIHVSRVRWTSHEACPHFAFNDRTGKEPGERQSGILAIKRRGRPAACCLLSFLVLSALARAQPWPAAVTTPLLNAPSVEHWSGDRVPAVNPRGQPNQRDLSPADNLGPGCRAFADSTDNSANHASRQRELTADCKPIVASSYCG